MDDFLTSNKTGAALLRDSEREFVENNGPLPINLRKVPRNEWDKFQNHEVEKPPSIAEFLRERKQGTLSSAEVHWIEDYADQFYNVVEPFYIATSPTLQSLGRAWAYVPEAARFLTGLSLRKDDDELFPAS